MIWCSLYLLLRRRDSSFVPPCPKILFIRGSIIRKGLTDSEIRADAKDQVTKHRPQPVYRNIASALFPDGSVCRENLIYRPFHLGGVVINPYGSIA